MSAICNTWDDEAGPNNRQACGDGKTEPPTVSMQIHTTSRTYPYVGKVQYVRKLKAKASSLEKYRSFPHLTI